MPTKGSPAGFGRGWPVAYLYEWEDLIAQAENETLKVTQREQNRVRLQPSLREVTRCEATIGWSAHYLAALEDLCKATNMSLGRDAGWVAVKRGGYADTWRQRHDRGCEIIAAG